MRFRGWLLTGVIVAGVGMGIWGLTRPVDEGTEVGHRIPDFRTLSLNTNDSVGLRSDFAGHVTLVNLWATWCLPCRAEMPSMERLYQAYHDRGLRVAGISLDDLPADTVLAYAREELEVSFEILLDRSNLSLSVLQGPGLPYSLLVDRQGVIRYVALGVKDWNSPEMREKVEALLPPLP